MGGVNVGETNVGRRSHAIYGLQAYAGRHGTRSREAVSREAVLTPHSLHPGWPRPPRASIARSTRSLFAQRWPTVLAAFPASAARQLEWGGKGCTVTAPVAATLQTPAPTLATSPQRYCCQQTSRLSDIVVHHPFTRKLQAASLGARCACTAHSTATLSFQAINSSLTSYSSVQLNPNSDVSGIGGESLPPLSSLPSLPPLPSFLPSPCLSPLPSLLLLLPALLSPLPNSSLLPPPTPADDSCCCDRRQAAVTTLLASRAAASP